MTTVVFADNENSVLTAVFGKTAKDYHRQKDEKGRWKREYYTMVNGGPVEGTIRDNTQENIEFVSLATVLAEHLARQWYYPATKAEQVSLLLVVNWGRTMPFSDHVYRDGVDNSLAKMNNMGLKRQAAELARASAANQTQTAVSLTGTPEDMEADAAASYISILIISPFLYDFKSEL